MTDSTALLLVIFQLCENSRWQLCFPGTTRLKMVSPVQYGTTFGWWLKDLPSLQRQVVVLQHQSFYCMSIFQTQRGTCGNIVESLIQTHVYTHTHRCRSAQWPIYFPTCALLFLFPDQQQLKCTWIQHDKNVLIVYDETPLKPDLGHVTINMSWFDFRFPLSHPRNY